MQLAHKDQQAQRVLQAQQELMEQLVHKAQQDQRVLQEQQEICLLYTSPSPRDRQKSRMPSSA